MHSPCASTDVWVRTSIKCFCRFLLCNQTFEKLQAIQNRVMSVDFEQCAISNECKVNETKKKQPKNAKNEHRKQTTDNKITKKLQTLISNVVLWIFMLTQANSRSAYISSGF